MSPATDEFVVAWTSYLVTPEQVTEEATMPARETAIVGAPCWADLMTSDTQRSRDFYGAVLGWTAEEPQEEHGGYFNFRKSDVRVAGCMASQPGVDVTDVWSVYLASDNAQKTLDIAEREGGQIHVPAMPVDELGVMAFLADPGGAGIGVWQPGTHQGFGLVDEPGTPSWFELHTRDYQATVSFYREVFGWDTQVMSDTPEFRYTTLKQGDDWLAGIMDASSFLPDGVPTHWSVYFGAADTDAALARVVDLGGSIVTAAQDTPYGRLATAADLTGAHFKLVQV
jgi:uncharacterized protein